MIKKILKLEVDSDEYGVNGERVYDDNNCIFSVSNLDECPEDAIIQRDLFSSYEYLRAIKYGMELAKQGYEEVGYISD